MGIEAIGSIGRVASVAPAVGRGVSLGSIGRLGAPRLEGGFSVSKIANPFLGVSKAPSFLENRGPSLLNPLGIETIRNPFKGLSSAVRPQVENKVRPQFSAASAVSEAEAIVRRAQTPSVIARSPEFIEGRRGNLIFSEQAPSFESKIATGRTRWYIPRDDTRVRTPEPAIVRLPNSFPRIETRPQPAPAVRLGTESKPISRAVRTTSTPTQKMVQAERIVEEKKVERKQEDKPQAKKSEKESVLKIKLVEAVQISEKRRLEIKAAVKRAKVKVESEGLKAITGRLVARLLSHTFWEHKSPIVGQGRDGTLNPTAEAVREDLSEYTSEEDAQRGLVQAVSKHIPVKGGEGGRLATEEEVREVLEGKEKEVLRSQTSAEVVVRRVVSKNIEVVKSGQIVNTVVEKKEEVTGEPTLKSLGLEEVFPKAS